MKMFSNEPVKLKKADRPLILAIDIGTSSTRAVVYDAQGRSVKKLVHQVGYMMQVTPDGGVFADPKFIVDATSQCIDAIMEAMGKDANDIKAVGFDTFWHNMMGIDMRGKPTTPLINWADTRPRIVIDDLRKRIDPEEAHRLTGCVLHPCYLPAKLLWIHKYNKEDFRRTTTWLSIGEYLYHVFFGKVICGISMASGTGLFNQNTCNWDDKMLSVLPVKSGQLGELGDLDTPLRGLKSEYARRWPALAQIPWLPAVGDGASSNVGTGAVKKDQLCIVMGTSGALRVMWEAKDVTIPSELWVYRVDRKRFLMGGALSDGGNLRKWMLSRLAIEGGKKSVDAALNTTKPGAHGLTMLPFWAGERSTGWHQNARGMINGFNLSTTREDILRVTLESLCYRYAAIYEIFKKNQMPVKQILASGGGFVDSGALTQLAADVIGFPITQSGEAEGSARGAAILALESIGAIKNIDMAPVPLGKTYKPHPKDNAIYKNARQRQQRLYDMVAKGIWETNL